jgi:hypothetical protein
MGKMATTLNGKLPEFQKYLLEKNLAPAKNVPSYARWVSRFLDYARRNEFSASEYQESTVLGFLEFFVEFRKFWIPPSEEENTLKNMRLSDRTQCSARCCQVMTRIWTIGLSG